jgi:hypothetical protein
VLPLVLLEAPLRWQDKNWRVRGDGWPTTCVTLLVTFVTAIACGQAPESGVVVSGMALAGPVCPVETNPPDPACAPRPVVDASILAISDSGEMVESRTEDDGRFSFVLAPGRYEIIAQPVEGLMGAPQPFEVEVLAESVDLGVVMYDTGIR